MSGIPTRGRYCPYGTQAVGYASAPRRTPQTWASGGPPVENILPRAFAYVATRPHNHPPINTQWRGSTTNQHPSPNSSVRPRTAQALSRPHMRFQLGVGRALAYQGASGGSSGAQILHHGAHPVSAVPINLPHHGGPPRSLHHGHNVPMANMPNIPRQSLADFHAAQHFHQRHQGITGWHPTMAQSSGASTLQPSLQVAIPAQQFPQKQDLSAAAAHPSQPASEPVQLFEDACSTNSFSVREEAGSTEAVSATEACPFPECKKECSRPQESERHIYDRHLPPHIYCEQPGCAFTSSRLYLLRNHYAETHPGVPMPEQDAFTIYDAKVLAKQVRTKEIGIEQAVHDACSFFEEKAKHMGKLGIWRWMKGAST